MHFFAYKPKTTRHNYICKTKDAIEACHIEQERGCAVMTEIVHL